MEKRNFVFLFVSLLVFVFISQPQIWAHDDKEEHHHHHKAHHDGCLNVVGGCEIGHIELKLDGDKLCCWLVGGGHDTGKSVRIPDKQINLCVVVNDHEIKLLVLKAKPIVLAEEKVGDCSYFEAQASWLKGIKDFDAYGVITFKGALRAFRIDYPHGFDPGHEHHHK